jgi:hypothetical protein
MSTQIAIECVSAEKKSIEVTLDEPQTALTEEQKQVIQMIYQKSKQATESILQDSKMEPTLKITQMIAQIIKIVEYVKVNDKKIVGSSKKGIVIELGRLLINEVLNEQKYKKEILAIYDLIAEQTLEVMIDVSQVVNTKAKEAASSCISWLCGK